MGDPDVGVDLFKKGLVQPVNHWSDALEFYRVSFTY
jgi:hypothetical protein